MVLAGGDGAIIDPAVPVKGLVPVAGKPMIEWVLDALRAAESIAEIAVVIPATADRHGWADRADHIVLSDGSFMDNAIAGFSALSGARPVLAVTADLPALTAEAVDDFAERSLESGALFTYPLVSEADMESQFPGSDRTYVKVNGSRVTGGNMMVLAPELVRRNRELGQRLFDARKSPVGMARVLGMVFILRYISGRLRVSDVEAKMQELVGAPCAAVYTRFAAIGADVDKPIDVVVSERVLYRLASGRNWPRASPNENR
jgi:GTP:adenosylcobinamide-phosphate guanylyltransferase